MMNYLAKYSIAQCILSGEKKDLTEGVAIVGILELTSKGILETDFSQMDVNIYIRGAITIESRLGGGVGFPNREHAFDVMSDNHSNLINAFLDTIPQEKIVLFDDGERYAVNMMKLIVNLAHIKGKHITCISIEPVRFHGRKLLKEFHTCWKEIEAEADESILLNLSHIGADTNSLRELQNARHTEIWKYVYALWKKLNKQK